MQRSRIDLAELKGHIVKKIGVERSTRYFYYLSRFLSQKLTKSEFDRICFRLLGRENLPLHNQLIRTILRNATVSKSSPINGVLPISPRKVRSGIRDRKIRDRPSPLENGDFAYQRPGRSAADERDAEFRRPVEKPRIPNKEQARLQLSASPLTAPIGITLRSACVARSCRTTSADLISCYDSGGLPDTDKLRKKMEHIAAAQGLGGVSMECANTLNHMLDVYLKRLIKTCLDFAGPRSTNVDKQQSKNKVLNGAWPSNNLQIPSPVGPYDITKEQHSVSLLDFRTAMELNTHQLGGDWPVLRERISMWSFEEHNFDV